MRNFWGEQGIPRTLHWGLYEGKRNAHLDFHSNVVFLYLQDDYLYTRAQLTNWTYMDTRLPTDPKLLNKIYE